MLNNNHPLIYTIIVTYNGEQYIRKCLKLLAESSLPTQIIVVDNASLDNTVDITLNEFPYVELIKNVENKGFGMANNIAMQLAMQRNVDLCFSLEPGCFCAKRYTGESSYVISKKS
jgi:GT2 family glycosyltransferase